MRRTKTDWGTWGKRDWTRFYTDSKIAEGSVDQIEIEVTAKAYRLCLDCDTDVTDGIDRFGEEIVSCYVPRAIFDIIVKGAEEQFERVTYYS